MNPLVRLAKAVSDISRYDDKESCVPELKEALLAFMPCSEKYAYDYWFKFRDSIYDVGKPTFSIVSNGEDEHPDADVIRISDCKFDVFIDVSCGCDRQDALERAQALCNVLNAEYPFHE